MKICSSCGAKIKNPIILMLCSECLQDAALVLDHRKKKDQSHCLCMQQECENQAEPFSLYCAQHQQNESLHYPRNPVCVRQ
jgi:hypothetical protein